MSPTLCSSLRPLRQRNISERQHIHRCISSLLSQRNGRPNDSLHLSADHQTPSQWQRRTQRYHRRPFSTTPRPLAGAAGVKQLRQPGKKPSMPSVKMHQEKQQREALASGDLPDDLGLLPDTFIMPFGRNKPSWVSNLPSRWKLERARAWVRLKEWIVLQSFRWMAVRPRPRLPSRSALPETATALHEKLYTRFAAGNIDALAPVLCPGFASSLNTRIDQRTPGTYRRWTLHNHLSKPRMVSLKAALLPGSTKKEARNGVMQAVVRIHSRQSLQNMRRVNVGVEGGKTVTKEVVVDSRGRVMPGEHREMAEGKETVEYFVLQRVLRRSQLGPWMVWGTAEEMTLARLERELRAGVR